MSNTPLRTVGLLGAGVIGGGWAARFLLNGVNVRLYGPSPGAVERVQKTLANARRAYRRLTPVQLPLEGSLTRVNSVEEAVHTVELVQESAPEHLQLKQRVLAEASRAAAPDTLICSSTSGIRPSLLQAQVDRPERLLVAHPFHPVYMLPLVELCAGHRTAPEALVRAAKIYRAVGMHPLVVRKEVDGFIANRLQEAMWREALWLVHDDVATVQEVDDAVRYSFGLRRAINGPFRMGEGGMGMRRFLEQWGPMLKCPWTKFSDVPELTDSFRNKLADQAEARYDNLNSADFERKRDDCYVAVLRGLRSEDYGAGETLARWEDGLRERISRHPSGSDLPRVLTRDIPTGWGDHDNQVSERRYLQLCGIATDDLLRSIGVVGEYLSNTGTYRAVETHLTYLLAIYPGDRIKIVTQVLGADDRHLHIFHVLVRERDEAPVAKGEQVLVHVEIGSRQIIPAQGNVRERVLQLARLHAELARPERTSAGISLC